MPWRETSPVDQRTHFIADHLRDVWSITELCALYGVSRKTGYKWIDQHTPATRNAPSPRPMPDRVPPLEYPDRFEVRYVSANGEDAYSQLYRRHV